MLRLETVRAVASLNLLERRFVEPPEPDGTLLTVALQQTVSFIRENGGATSSELARIMRASTPFERLSDLSYQTLLTANCEGDRGLLRQASDGRYFLSPGGEKLLESYDIYAVFQAFDTWAVWSRSHKVGELTRRMPVAIGDSFYLGGRAWQAVSVDEGKNLVMVEPSASGTAPYFSINSQEETHSEIAAEMRRVLADRSFTPRDCDRKAAQFLKEGRDAYLEARLADHSLIEDPAQELCHLFTWRGSRFNSVLAVLLRLKQLPCEANEIGVTISSSKAASISDALTGHLPSIREISKFLESIEEGKYDKWIPEALLREDWAKRHGGLERELHTFCRSLQGTTVGIWPNPNFDLRS
jgi:ATP-dependent Lhr-like helicase